MKKQLLTIVVVIALCFGLTVPALAYDMGKVGENDVVCTGGYARTGFIDQYGSLWMCGYTGDGNLGNNDSPYGTNMNGMHGTNIPVKVLDGVVTVNYGKAAIKTDGSLWMWGDNTFGELGNGGIANNSLDGSLIQTVPVKVLDSVAAVSCGGNHTAAIKTDGSLWMWGGNSHGQLGNGGVGNSVDEWEGVYQTVPVKVMDSVVAVSCGKEHTAVIKSDGSLWMWGSNSYGELGNGGKGNAVIDPDVIGPEIYQTVPVKVLDNVVAVSCGNSSTAAVKSDSSLWTWGSNTFGSLGNGTQERSNVPVKILDSVMEVSCGDYYAAAIKTDGSLWMWGMNNSGELGNGGVGNAILDLEDGSTPDVLQTVPIKVLDNVAAVSCGGSYTVAIKDNGSLWTWGLNHHGQLGYKGGNATYVDGSPIQTVPKQITGLTGPQAVRLTLNGGTGVGTLWTNADGTITVPTNPSRPGYTFGGWYTNVALTNPWNFNDKVTNTMTLYAKWIPVSSTATTTGKSSQSISLNGESVAVDAYTLKTDNGGDVTYVKLRDVAALLNGTSAQFDVDWRNNTIYVETNTPYIHQAGTELQPIQGTDGTYRWNQAPILFDGKTAPLEGIVITDGNGGGHTFFKLRDLADAIGFTVNWSAERGIYIETN